MRLGSLFLTFPTRALTGQHVISWPVASAVGLCQFRTSWSQFRSPAEGRQLACLASGAGAFQDPASGRTILTTGGPAAPAPAGWCWRP